MRHRIYEALLAIGCRAARSIASLWHGVRTIVAIGATALLLGGCGGGDEVAASKANSIPLGVPSERTAVRLPEAISEVSPPSSIQRLRSRLDRYRPQVTIAAPRAGSVLEDSTVTVSLDVSGLPVFRDERFGLGPHVRLLVDDREDLQVFDPTEPIVLNDLAPGTHTLRAFAVRPWSESFKNEGAFAQTTFHIFTKTNKNAPDPARPLLTYNQPFGAYGAEPILLDFYLTNAPLHAIAREFDDDEVRDWRVRVTVNGQSFFVDRWEPIYLQGVKPGRNWLQIELLDEKGETIENTFNSTVRIFEYDPELKDGLSEIISGAVDWSEALRVVGVEPIESEPLEAEDTEDAEDTDTDPATEADTDREDAELEDAGEERANPAAESETESESEPGSALEAELETETPDVEGEPAADTESIAEPETELETELETEPEIETNPDAELGADEPMAPPAASDAPEAIEETEAIDTEKSDAADTTDAIEASPEAPPAASPRAEKTDEAEKTEAVEAPDAMPPSASTDIENADRDAENAAEPREPAPDLAPKPDPEPIETPSAPTETGAPETAPETAPE